MTGIAKRFFVVLSCVLFVGLAGCSMHTNQGGGQARNYQKDIDTIYYCHWAVFRAMGDTTAYKIDLKNKAFYEITTEAENSSDRWGTDDGDVDFVLVSSLQGEDIDTFFRQTARHGFTHWARFYQDHTVLDGATWNEKIVFSDGTIKESSGTNKYPETWGDIMQDFEDLTGRKF